MQYLSPGSPSLASFARLRAVSTGLGRRRTRSLPVAPDEKSSQNLSPGKVLEARIVYGPGLWKKGSAAQVRNVESIPACMHFVTPLPPASCSTQHSPGILASGKRFAHARHALDCQKNTLIDKKCADCSVSRRGSRSGKRGPSVIPDFHGESLRTIPANLANWFMLRVLRRRHKEEGG